MKNYKMKYPLDSSNKNFDGKVHSIVPSKLESFEFEGQQLYRLNYFDNDLNKAMYTILKKEGSSFIKLPLSNYSSPKLLFAMLFGTNHSIDELPEYIDCYQRIINIDEIGVVAERVATAVQTANPPGPGGLPTKQDSIVDNNEVMVGSAFPPPNPPEWDFDFEPIDAELTQCFKVIYYNRNEGLYYWDKDCIDPVTGPFLLFLLKANARELNKGITQLLADYDGISYEIRSTNKVSSKPKTVTLYQYQGIYYWDSDCKVIYRDELGSLDNMGFSKNIVDLGMFKKHFTPEPVKGTMVESYIPVFSSNTVLGVKREYVGHIYYNRFDNLYYWDKDCIDLITGPFLVYLINNKVDTMVKYEGITYDIETVRKTELKATNPVYLYLKGGKYYWDKDCTLLLENGLDSFGTLDIDPQIANLDKIQLPTVTTIYYNNEDGLCYKDKECTYCLGKISDVGTYDRTVNIVTTPEGVLCHIDIVSVAVGSTEYNK